MHIHLQRLYISDAVLAPQSAIALEKEQIHYLMNVLRLKAGDKIRVFNGKDGEWLAELIEISRKKCVLIATERLRSQEDASGYHLIFSPLKKDATEDLVRMGCEMGVRYFHPVILDRTNMRNFNPTRLNNILIEASEQSERTDVPVLFEPEKFKDFLTRFRRDYPEQTIAVALERNENRDTPKNAYALLIGPEGGFSYTERDFFQSSDLFKALDLGKTVLRAPTAAVAGLAVLKASNS